MKIVNSNAEFSDPCEIIREGHLEMVLPFSLDKELSGQHYLVCDTQRLYTGLEKCRPMEGNAGVDAERGRTPSGCWEDPRTH